MDEQVLVDLQAMWEAKLQAAGVFPDPKGNNNSSFAFPPASATSSSLGGSASNLTADAMQALMARQIQQQQMQQMPNPVLPQQPPMVVIPRMVIPTQAQLQAHLQTQAHLFALQQQQLQQNQAKQPSQSNDFIPLPPSNKFKVENALQEDRQTSSNPSVSSAPVDQTKKIKDKDTTELGDEDDLSDESSSSNSSVSGDDDDPNANIILCLYEKVSKTKTRWRAIFQAGYAHLNNAEWVFNKQQADMDFS